MLTRYFDVLTNWRDTPLFRYGYLPIRLLAAGVAWLAACVFVLGVYLMWFEPSAAKYAWKATR
jgi:hypothetical protein